LPIGSAAHVSTTKPGMAGMAETEVTCLYTSPMLIHSGRGD